LIVSAAAAVNAVGDILDEKGEIIAGARTPEGTWRAQQDPMRTLTRGTTILHAHTVLVALLTNARLTKVEANRVAQRGHDGVARAVRPAHTSYDGDTVFCLASGEVDADMDLVAEWGAETTARAIRRAVASHQAG
jgi:L-aminopeptidase/D-esterase-like protein